MWRAASVQWWKTHRFRCSRQSSCSCSSWSLESEQKKTQKVATWGVCTELKGRNRPNGSHSLLKWTLHELFGGSLVLTCATVAGVAVIFHKCKVVAAEKHKLVKLWSALFQSWCDCWSSVPKHTMLSWLHGYRHSCSPALACTHAAVDLRAEDFFFNFILSQFFLTMVISDVRVCSTHSFCPLCCPSPGSGRSLCRPCRGSAGCSMREHFLSASAWWRSSCFYAARSVWHLKWHSSENLLPLRPQWDSRFSRLLADHLHFLSKHTFDLMKLSLKVIVLLAFGMWTYLKEASCVAAARLTKKYTGVIVRNLIASSNIQHLI